MAELKKPGIPLASQSRLPTLGFHYSRPANPEGRDVSVFPLPKGQNMNICVSGLCLYLHGRYLLPELKAGDSAFEAKSITGVGSCGLSEGLAGSELAWSASKVWTCLDDLFIHLPARPIRGCSDKRTGWYLFVRLHLRLLGRAGFRQRRAEAVWLMAVLSDQCPGVSVFC